MTIRAKFDNNLFEIGKIIREHRLSLADKNSREEFISSAENEGLVPYGWISVKTLSNIENGKNMPSLKTLKYISLALQMGQNDKSGLIELIEEIEKYL